MKKVKLTGLDRLNIVNKVLPKKGGMLEMQTAKEIIEITGIKTDEFDDYGLKEPEPGRLTWDERIRTEKEFKLNDKHIELLKKGVHVLDSAEEIDFSLLETCEKIINFK